MVFLCFVLISAVFWLFTTLNEEYKIDLQVPVSLTNVPRNAVITEAPEALTVSLRDKGFILLSYKYGKGLRPITIDFNSHANSTGRVALPATDYLRQIQAQLSASTTVSALKPQEITFYFNYGESKRVPVRFLGQVKASDEAYVAGFHFKPDSVTVFAPSNILDTITAAYTATTYLRDLSQSRIAYVPFQKPAGTKFDPDSARLEIIIDRMVEKTVSVPVQQVNFPASKVLRTFPAKVNITFQVGMGLYRRITADDFVLVVNYEDLQGGNVSRCHLALKSVPEGVRNAHISPQDVDYVIEELPEEEDGE